MQFIGIYRKDNIYSRINVVKIVAIVEISSHLSRMKQNHVVKGDQLITLQTFVSINIFAALLFSFICGIRLLLPTAMCAYQFDCRNLL